MAKRALALRRLTCGSVPILAVLAVAALGSVQSFRAAERPAAPAAEPGVRVVMDPASGRVVARPTARQLGRANAPVPRAERRRPRDLRFFEAGEGVLGVDLDGWARHELKVERGADGRLRTVCSRGDEHGGES